MYHEETPKWIPFLRTFGEIAIVKAPTKLQAKLTNRGIPVVIWELQRITRVINIHFGIPSLNTFLNHLQQYFWIRHMLTFVKHKLLNK
jgi:hypothetical protein